MENRKIYYINGSLQQEYIINFRGLKHGVLKFFDRKGNLLKLENYFFGELHGIVIHYHNNGAVDSIGNYEYGKKQGRWVKFNRDASISSVINYNQGSKEGIAIYYKSNDFEVITYKKGRIIKELEPA